MPKKLKLIITFLILTAMPLIYTLNAETSWSEPIQLSRDGTYPALNFGYPAITVDSNGTIHAFWEQGLEIDGDWTNGFYSQIEYTRSTDGGITWTPTENLTPEYTTSRIAGIKAVCDSDNYVHLVYLRGIEAKDVLYKMFDGVSWKPVEPYLISPHSTKTLLLKYDGNDRLFCTWYLGSTSYYSYCDLSEGHTAWSPAKRIHEDIDYLLDGFVFDKNDNLHSINSYKIDDLTRDYRPYYCFFSRDEDRWIIHEEISNYDEKTLGSAIALSSKDSLHANTAVGPSLNNNKGNHLTGYYIYPEWSVPYDYGTNNTWDREMYIDSNDYLHLFELHYYSTDIMGIIHSTGKNKVWSTVQITVPDINYSYSEPNVAFDKINNKFYMIYKESDKVNSISRIFFHHKQNDTSIGAEEGFVADVHELYQNYPNPFNSSTLITYSVAGTADVRLSVYNVKGELVRELVNRRQKMGRYSVVFKADDLNSGVYFCKLEVDGVEKISRKMVNLK